MAKQSPRKGPRRPPAAPVLDPDLQELAEVLAEHQLDASSEGWFALPWRNGLNAALLCIAEAHHRVGLHAHGDQDHVSSVRKFVSLAMTDAAFAYREADEFKETLSQFGAGRWLRGALRCLQLHVSLSSGGGWGYNDVLRVLYLHEGLDSGTAKSVEYWRCCDALGTPPTMHNDANDRARRAFRTAWSRGLYHAAYSIKPAKKDA